jgi:5-methylcytosine-specific restriction endonuclease McrA
MTYVPADLRRRIIERASGCCEYCRTQEDDSGAVYHVEHIIAVSHGGETVEDNVAYSCARCNF